MPGLDPLDRCTVEITIAVGRAAWIELGDAIEASRDCGVERSVVVETLLQGTLFYGFPRAVSAFEQLGERWPAPQTQAGESRPDPRVHRDAGLALFDAIYADNAPSVRAMLRGFHPEFHDFVIEAAYGRILSRREMDARVRELCAIAALAVLDQLPQLVAHARGALRFGASEAAIRETLWMAGRCDEELIARILRRRQTP